MDHSHRGAIREARTSVAIREADGKVTTLRTLDDVAEYTKELSIATTQGFQYLGHRASNLEAQHASLREDHAGVSDRVLELENAVKIGCMMIFILALYVMVLQNQRLASLSQRLSVAESLWAVQQQCLFLFSRSFQSRTGTCSSLAGQCASVQQPGYAAITQPTLLTDLPNTEMALSPDCVI